MATKTLTTRIILRNDTAANWTASNPTLLKGEIGQETDTGKYKIGNGTDNWNLLGYFANLTLTEKTSLDTLIEMLNNDNLGNVKDVQVNNVSVINSDKVAKIIIGSLSYSANAQSVAEESFENSIVLHKVAKTGDYNDLINKISVVNDLNSSSTTSALSAYQGNVLKNMVSAIPSAKTYATISSLVSGVNALVNNSVNIGTNLFVVDTNVPDFWVSSVSTSNVPYNYTTDEAFISAVSANGSVQVGYYLISMLETQKVDLTDYYTISQVDTLINGLSNRISAIENDTTILKSTDTFILDGGNSEV